MFAFEIAKKKQQHDNQNYYKHSQFLSFAFISFRLKFLDSADSKEINMSQTIHV